MFILGLILCLGLSVAAAYIGVAAIVGSFLAGMTMAEASENHPRMHRQINGVTEFLVPFFLVNIVPALLGVPLRTYALATLIGIVPGSFVYASVGAGLGAIFDRMGEFQPEDALTSEILAG